MVRKRLAERGSMLATVMILMFFLGALTFAASGMVRSGMQTTNSSLRHTQADWAADYALNKAIDQVLKNGCDLNEGPVGFNQNQASYTLQATSNSDERFCFIRVEGLLHHGGDDQSSTVVKTVTLPLVTSAASGGEALRVKSLGYNLNIHGDAPFIESECVGIGYESCSWCDHPEPHKAETLDKKIIGSPKTTQDDFNLNSYFDASDDQDVQHKMEQEVLDRAQVLINQGLGHCVYLPTDNWGQVTRAGKSCETQSHGSETKIRCVQNGGDKYIYPNSCSEMVIYADSLNINHAIPDSSMLFASIGNNTMINKSVNGIISSDVLNIHLQNNEQIDGVFVGNTANNLNLQGNSQIRGLLSYLSESNLALNIQGNQADQEMLCGALIANGNVDFSRNQSGKIKYCQDEINKWRDYLAILKQSSCDGLDAIDTHLVDQTRYKVF